MVLYNGNNIIIIMFGLNNGIKTRLKLGKKIIVSKQEEKSKITFIIFLIKKYGLKNARNN